MISHVEQRSSRRKSRGWFFFLARVVGRSKRLLLKSLETRNSQQRSLQVAFLWTLLCFLGVRVGVGERERERERERELKSRAGINQPVFNYELCEKKNSNQGISVCFSEQIRCQANTKTCCCHSILLSIHTSQRWPLDFEKSKHQQTTELNGSTHLSFCLFFLVFLKSMKVRKQKSLTTLT